MRKITLILATILGYSLSFPVISQEIEKKSYKNAITFNVTRLALLEARFGYERNLSHGYSLRTTIGYQFPNSSETFGSFSSRLSIPYYYEVSKGGYISFGFSHITKPKSHFYIAPEIYFSYNFYDEKYYRFSTEEESDSYICLQSMNLKKYGFKLMFGKKASMLPTKKTRLQFDFFGGVGLQYRSEALTTYAKNEGTSSTRYFEKYATFYNPPIEEHKVNLYPSFHGGILLSLPF